MLREIYQDCGDIKWQDIPLDVGKRLDHLFQRAASESRTPSPSLSSSDSRSEVSRSTDVTSLQASSPDLSNTESNVGNFATADEGAARVYANPPYNHLGDHLRVVFLGANAAHGIRVSQIEVQHYKDGQFYETLRDRYLQLRGFMRNWFGVWIYSHCDFVMVNAPGTYNPN